RGDLARVGPPRGKVRDGVFGERFVPPVSDGSGRDRNLLRKANALLLEAGDGLKDTKRVTPKGEPFTIEFLIDDPSFEPHHLAYVKNLQTLGITTSLRVGDPGQYKARQAERHFDMMVERLSFSLTPGDELRTYLSSEAAGIKGSFNIGGIADPVIDALIVTIIAAQTRPALVTACKALDRVIRAGRYWVPQYY